ncbi:MAG: hypothetical protein RML94_00265 [Bacteroidia bacterium]|nr:hypothetical protein [Bacteroidia bacterium]
MKQYIDKCLSRLEEGYTFLKNYELDGEDGSKKNIEYSYIFSKNTKYMIVIANSSAETKGIYVTLYDSERRKITSSYVNGKFYPIISYTCSATGIYYMTFTFENTKDYCAASVLAFKR